MSMLNASENDFAVIHINIRNVSFDELVSTLVSLKLNFNAIGVSETWGSFEIPPKTNVETLGYCHFSCQSYSQNVGVTLCIKRGLTPILRPDLGKKNTIEF